jgi:hypothetical protein
MRKIESNQMARLTTEFVRQRNGLSIPKQSPSLRRQAALPVVAQHLMMTG